VAQAGEIKHVFVVYDNAGEIHRSGATQ
jgi:hypothetical protein